MGRLEQENMELRSQLLDCQLRERQDMERINKLEKLCIKLQEVIESRAGVSREEAQLLTMMTSTFSDCFGIESCSEIWAKQKEILAEWMDTKIKEGGLHK